MNDLKQRSRLRRLKRFSPFQRRYFGQIAKSRKCASSNKITENLKKNTLTLILHLRRLEKTFKTLGIKFVFLVSSFPYSGCYESSCHLGEGSSRRMLE